MGATHDHRSRAPRPLALEGSPRDASARRVLPCRGTTVQLKLSAGSTPPPAPSFEGVRYASHLEHHFPRSPDVDVHGARDHPDRVGPCPPAARGLTVRGE